MVCLPTAKVGAWTVVAVLHRASLAKGGKRERGAQLADPASPAPGQRRRGYNKLDAFAVRAQARTAGLTSMANELMDAPSPATRKDCDTPKARMVSPPTTWPAGIIAKLPASSRAK